MPKLQENFLVITGSPQRVLLSGKVGQLKTLDTSAYASSPRTQIEISKVQTSPQPQYRRTSADYQCTEAQSSNEAIKRINRIQTQLELDEDYSIQSESSFCGPS